MIQYGYPGEEIQALEPKGHGNYAEFLKAKAASDPLGLYNTNMADSSRTGSLSSGYGGITRSCTPTCKPGCETLASPTLGS